MNEMGKKEPVMRKNPDDTMKDVFKEFREEMREIVADTTKAILEVVRDENKKLRQYIDDRFKEMRREMEERFKQTDSHFDAVAETIHQDLAGANKDEIAGIQTKQNNHEGRITHLEERAGVR